MASNSFSGPWYRAPPVLSEEVFRLMTEMLSVRDVLTMRTVCQNWKKTIDDTIQKLPFSNIELLTKDNRNLQQVFQQQFATEEITDQFLKDMRNVRNPFPGRSIILKDVFNWYPSKLLLWEFGPQVWHLQISRPSEVDFLTIGNYLEENFPHIHQLFLYLINLKTLVMDGFYLPDNYVNLRMMASIYSKPFPTLENLEVFDVGNSSAPPLVNAILKGCKNLKRLIISKHTFDFIMDLPKLEDLKVGIHNTSDLYTLNNLKSPLKNVELQYCRNSKQPVCSLVDWFGGLKQFSKSLEGLILGVDVDFAEAATGGVTLDFPKLEMLNIENYPEASLSYLPTFIGLKKLFVTTLADDADEEIRMEMWDEDDEIWHRMPQLQTIQLYVPPDESELSEEIPEIFVVNRNT
ncbi:unnamed protein product [Orchesella dallaii]|uniref:F-box domain-containing protein n=1 Tax=Orchesella dallaii TaxID=48710 RepID=A0ABP1RB60_9HEXA